MLNMAMFMNLCIKSVISNIFELQIQFVTFLRGHPGTPIDSAPVLLSGKSCSTSHTSQAIAGQGVVPERDEHAAMPIKRVGHSPESPMKAAPRLDDIARASAQGATSAAAIPYYS